MAEDHSSSERPPIPAGAATHAAALGALSHHADFELAEAREGVDWRRLLSTFWRFKWLLALVTALGTAAGIGATRILKPEYLAQATIWIHEPDRRRPDRGPIGSAQLLESIGWVDLLKSYVVLDEVVNDLGLYFGPRTPADTAALASFRVKDHFRPGEYRLTIGETGRTYTLETRDGVPLERGAIDDSVGAPFGFAWTLRPGSTRPGQRIEFEVVTLRDAAQRLAQSLRVEMDLNGNFLRLELRGHDPRRITAVVNAAAERYVQVAGELKRNKVKELARILEEQLRYAERALRDAEAALEEFRIKTITLPFDRVPAGPSTAERAPDPVIADYFTLKIEREELRRDREAIGRLLAQARGDGLSVRALEAIGSVRGSSELSRPLDELTEKKAELRALKYRYADEYPPVERLAAEIAALERQTIPTLTRNLVAALATREAELERRLDAASQELRQMPARSMEEARLGRAVAIAEDLYTTVQQRYEETRLAEASSIPDVRILDAAVVPRRPVKDAARRLILLGFFSSLGLALGAAVLLDRIDPRVQYPDQVSRGLGLTILGAIPHLKTPGSGDQGDGSHELVEALRGIRLNLVYAYGTGPVLVTVTSPGSGDGKSFLAANLALSFAEAGYRILLIDGDLRRGSLHRRFNVPRKPGLADFLKGEVTLEEIVQARPHSTLSFIGCGTRTHGAPELLGTPAMARLIYELRLRYDVILIDSPPLGAGVDPYIIAARTGNVLLVLRTGFSHRDVAQAKLEVLARLPIRVLGTVLNDVRSGIAYRYYSYYAYYLPGYETRDERSDGGDRAGLPQPV